MNTRKDYQRAAKIVAAHFSNVPNGFGPIAVASFNLAETVRESFIEFFLADNPRFDALRFRDACNPLSVEMNSTVKKGGK